MYLLLEGIFFFLSPITEPSLKEETLPQTENLSYGMTKYCGSKMFSEHLRGVLQTGRGNNFSKTKELPALTLSMSI